jgi:hypothetical protein
MDDKKYLKIFDSSVWLIILTFILAYTASLYFASLPLDSVSEGDFGRDLYNFYLVSQGQFPYIDFNWIYGPLVPLVYGLIFKIFGVSALIAVTAWYINFFACVYLTYYNVKSFSNRLFGSIAGVLFIVYYAYIIQTFNHLAGALSILLALLFIRLYLEKDKTYFLYLGAFACFMIAIIKLNMGLAFSAGFFFILFVEHYINKKSFKLPLQAFLIFLFSTILFYSILIIPSPIDQLSKSFPYSSSSLSSASGSLLESLFTTDASALPFLAKSHPILTSIFFIITLNFWYVFWVISCFIMAFILYKKLSFTSEVTYLLVLGLTGLLCAHEFIMVGSHYSLRFWVLPITIISVFYILEVFIKTWNDKKFYKPVFISFLILLISVSTFKFYINSFYKPNNQLYYPSKRLNISFSSPGWFYTMFKTLEYIDKNTKPGEMIFTIPYNTFYNFASNREFPTRITEFLLISNVTENEQRQIIEEIEKNKVRLIIYSNKIGQNKFGVGKFGETHCKILNKYILNNYALDTWYSTKEELYNYAPIYFFKRKTPFNRDSSTQNEDK